METIRSKVAVLLRTPRHADPPPCQRRDSGLNAAATSSAEPPPPASLASATAAVRPGKPISPLKLMTLATISLSATCLCSTIVQSQLLHEGALRGRYDAANDDGVSYFTGSGSSGGAGAARRGLDLLDSRSFGGAPAAARTTSAAGGGAGEGGDTDAGGGGGNGDGGGSESATEGFGEQSQEEFLVAVKRRLKIETPLDKTFWRPYARLSSEGQATLPAGANKTNLIFVAGAEGTGHHFVTALMMRLSQLMPMTLVQEQMFQALWWKPHDRSPATFWGALESFFEWVGAAKANGKHPAFCARTCLRYSGLKHCSWISGLQQQMAGRLLDGKAHNISYQPIGQMFSYPFSRSGNETEDGTHFPRLEDLQYLCELAGIRLKVIVLWREPVDAIMSMNNRGLPKIWRRAGRTFKLHKQVGLFLSQLDELHTQLQSLHPHDYRIINYTDVLLNGQDYVRDLAAFLEVPQAQLSRAFTLSMKAKPKKHPRAPTTAPDGTWSDEVRRSFIESRLAEAERGPHPPACCGSWTRRLAGRRVVQMPVPRDAGLKPARTPHWFTRWAQAAPPPRRLQEISFTHVVNPFDPGNNTERARSQTVTLASISHAAALATAQGISVELVCAIFAEDEAYLAREPVKCTFAHLNASAITALPQFRHPVRLPFLNMILWAGHQSGKGKYLVYSNMDIGVQPPFYIKMARQMQVMPDVPVSSIREEFEHVDATFDVESAIARRGTGLSHPGHDCWVFPREWVPRLILGFTLIGVSMVATDMMQALHAISGCRMSLLSPHLTFHFVEGDSVVKHPSNQRARNDKIFTGLYTAWNCAQFARNRRDVLATYPEYGQCWFSQQAEWNVYSYQCGATIEHLPHEFKLLWHNDSIKPGGAYIDCNLPSLCARCRGRDGSRRPPADLMAAVPCGFCRCAGDLGNPPYITPPVGGEVGALAGEETANVPRGGVQEASLDQTGAAVVGSGGAVAQGGKAARALPPTGSGAVLLPRSDL